MFNMLKAQIATILSLIFLFGLVNSIVITQGRASDKPKISKECGDQFLPTSLSSREARSEQKQNSARQSQITNTLYESIRDQRYEYGKVDIEIIAKTHNITPEIRLLISVINEDIDEIKRLVKIIDVDAINNIELAPGNKLLHLIAHSLNEKSVEILKILIEAGVDPNVRNLFNNTPLHTFVGKTEGIVREESVRLLLKAGANPSATNKHGAVPLHYVFDVKVVEMFMEAGVNVNFKDKFGYTPLDYIINTGVMRGVAEDARGIEDENVAGVGADYVGNVMAGNMLLFYNTLRDRNNDKKLLEAVNVLVGHGATPSVETPEVVRVLNLSFLITNDFGNHKPINK